MRETHALREFHADEARRQTRLLQAALHETDEMRLDDRRIGQVHRERRRVAFPHGGIAMQPADEFADHAPIDHRRQAVIRRGLHHALG